MARVHPTRTVKICPVCGEGYDAFKARDARGRYCSPACLAEARRRQRLHAQADEPEPAVGPAVLPPTITIGHHGAVFNLDSLDTPGDERRLV